MIINFEMQKNKVLKVHIDSNSESIITISKFLLDNSVEIVEAPIFNNKTNELLGYLKGYK